MRTAHLLPISPSMHCSGGPGGYLVWGRVTGPGGVPGPRGVYLVWGVGVMGAPGPGGVPARGGVPGLGGYLPRYSPPVNRMTNRCKNITLPQTSFAGGKNCSENRY